MNLMEQLYNDPEWRERNAEVLRLASIDELTYGFSIIQFKENSNDLELLDPFDVYGLGGLDKA